MKSKKIQVQWDNHLISSKDKDLWYDKSALTPTGGVRSWVSDDGSKRITADTRKYYTAVEWDDDLPGAGEFEEKRMISANDIKTGWCCDFAAKMGKKDTARADRSVDELFATGDGFKNFGHDLYTTNTKDCTAAIPESDADYNRYKAEKNSTHDERMAARKAAEDELLKEYESGALAKTPTATKGGATQSSASHKSGFHNTIASVLADLDHNALATHLVKVANSVDARPTKVGSGM